MAKDERETSKTGGQPHRGSTKPGRSRQSRAVRSESPNLDEAGRASHEPLSDDADRFVGVRDEVRRLQSRVREEIGVEDTARYQRAAELFAEILDCDAVDSILELTPGTTRGWASEEAFMRRALHRKVRTEQYGNVGEDLGRPSSPPARGGSSACSGEADADRYRDAARGHSPDDLELAPEASLHPVPGAARIARARSPGRRVARSSGPSRERLARYPCDCREEG
jgi:hypothetical protein